MLKVILEVELQPSEATVAGVRRKLRLKRSQIDADFGVQRLRPGKNDYAIRIDADVAEQIRGEQAAAPAGHRVSVALVH